MIVTPSKIKTMTAVSSQSASTVLEISAVENKRSRKKELFRNSRRAKKKPGSLSGHSLKVKTELTAGCYWACMDAYGDGYLMDNPARYCESQCG